MSSLLFICCPEFTANFYLRLTRFLAVYEIKLQKTPALLDSLRCSSFLTLFVVPHTKAVRCPCYNIQWFDGDAAQKIVDVVHQCESTLFKIWIIFKNCYQFYPIFQFLTCAKANFSKLTILNWKMKAFEIKPLNNVTH